VRTSEAWSLPFACIGKLHSHHTFFTARSCHPTHIETQAASAHLDRSHLHQEHLQESFGYKRRDLLLGVIVTCSMPRSRRPPPLQAAGALSARLPLGTPSFIRDVSPHSQQQQQQQQQHQAHGAALTGSNKHAPWTFDGSHDSSDSGIAASRLDSSNSSHLDLTMASKHSTDQNQPLSLAAAKLERQNQRIAATNATLTSQLPSEKNKQSTRSKGKAWKPFDFATDVDDSTQLHPADAPAVETRVNVFRAPSQVTTLSRPISRVSSHTHDSSYSESEHRDSSFLESDDFQVFTNRKKSGPAIPAFNEKPTLQHATVEATLSKRDITDVFGNELPGPGFMDGNPGTVDGQLQFIQHPNGDVSARQWSSSRFGWENIGQYSNIRKKIEGQLAADRLKGETAWQSLQQNTLAYFRTVAKQREADAIGLPFGVKDIAACLPDTRPPSTAPTGPRRVTSKVEMPERPSTMMPRQDIQSSHTSVVHRENTASMPPKQNFEPLPRSQGVSSHLDHRLDPARYFTPAPRENAKEDPFTSAATFHQPYGQTTRNNMHDQQMANWSSYQSWNTPLAMYSPYYPGYPMPNVNFSSNYSYIAHAPKPLYEQANTGDPASQGPGMHIGWPPQMHPPGVQQTKPQLPPLNTSPFARESKDVDFVFNQAKPAARAKVQPAPSASSQAASPLNTRNAMREQVMKMGEHAKERTKSEANIGRTVMYDPFQDLPQKDPTPPPEPVKQEALPMSTFQSSTSSSLGHFPLLGLGMIPGLSELSGRGQDPFPTTLAPSVKMPFNATPALPENDLRDSSPDREWQRESAEVSDEHTIPLPLASSLKQWDADKLDEWLWSGNKFARQEDFHQRIMATDATPTRRTQTTSTITSARPIALPSRFKPPPSIPQPSNTGSESNILTNRLLVPVLENLASYVQGPIEKRRDYFCQWVKAPDWALDRSATGNDSFFDSQWGQPPERLGRDPRYQPVPRGLDVRFGSYDAPRAGHTVAMPGMDRRFGFQGRF
jgi:hypothetical protein